MLISLGYSYLFRNIEDTYCFSFCRLEHQREKPNVWPTVGDSAHGRGKTASSALQRPRKTKRGEFLSHGKRIEERQIANLCVTVGAREPLKIDSQVGDSAHRSAQRAPVNRRIGNINTHVLRRLPIARLAGALRATVAIIVFPVIRGFPNLKLD